MSAYMVEDVTINRIVSYIMNQEMRGMPMGLGLVGPSHEELQDLGTRMWKLNSRALQERYRDATTDPRFYQFRFELVSRVQAYKSLQCWLYQCAEGGVPSDPLYKTMTEVLHRIGADIIGELPAYEKAVWG